MEKSETADGYSKLLYSRPAKPANNREETINVMNALMGTTPPEEQLPRPPLSNVFGAGPLFLSDLHASMKSDGVVVGIDEAGRGSVLGPMVYGAAFWNAKAVQGNNTIPKDFNDSKQLTEEVRSKLLQRILETSEIGFAVRVLHASEISRNMLRPEPYNLNQMSHDAAMEIIQALLDAGVKIACCYIDTVGIAHYYQRKLERQFPGLQFVVESKADAKYPCCSAGSVVAKVVRDRMLENWQFSEPALASISTKFGSGYPSDPVCKQWMEDNLHCQTFAYPDLVRFSWAPTKKRLDNNEKVAKVVFAADIEDDEDEDMTINKKRQQDQMSAFLGKKQQKRLPYFQRNGLRAVSKFSL